MYLKSGLTRGVTFHGNDLIRERLLYWLKSWMTVFCILLYILGPVMNICHNQQNGRVAHPTNCAKYYNCTDQSHPVLQECPYPFLYSPIHMSCQNFEYVQCHQRYEPKAPCEYKDHQNLNKHNNYIKEGIWISSLFTFIYTSKVTVVWLSCDWHAIFIWLVILLGMQYHRVIMKRKLTVMFNNSTNIGKTNTHPLKPWNIWHWKSRPWLETDIK